MNTLQVYQDGGSGLHTVFALLNCSSFPDEVDNDPGLKAEPQLHQGQPTYICMHAGCVCVRHQKTANIKEQVPIC